MLHPFRRYAPPSPLHTGEKQERLISEESVELEIINKYIWRKGQSEARQEVAKRRT